MFARLLIFRAEVEHRPHVHPVKLFALVISSAVSICRTGFTRLRMRKTCALICLSFNNSTASSWIRCSMFSRDLISRTSISKAAAIRSTANAFLHSPGDHRMLLDRRQSIDPGVIT